MHSILFAFNPAPTYEIEASVLSGDIYSASNFAATSKGETKATELQFKLVFNVFDGAENVIATSKLTTTASAKVTNDPYQAEEHGKANGDGGLTIVA